MATTQVPDTAMGSKTKSTVAVACLLASLSIPLHTQAGTITLITSPGQDHGGYRCTLDIPPAGAGKTIRLSLADRGGPGQGNCFQMQPDTITMKDIPSAAKILLTDDWMCNTTLGSKAYKNFDPSDNKNFVIKLETMSMLSQLPNIGIDRLFEFEEGKPVKIPEAKGIKLTEKTFNGNGRVTSKLSCLEITISDDIDTPTLDPVLLGSMSTSNDLKESDHSFTCSNDKVMVGRKHEGDENGDTYYTCQTVQGRNQETFVIKESFTSAKIEECGRRKPDGEDKDAPDKTCAEAVNYDKDSMDYIYFTCPTDSVMIGRAHKGDENGYTDYKCATLYKNTEDEKNKLVVKLDDWSDAVKEPGSDFTCGTDKVMVGRAHESDENGYTKYRCGQLFYPATK